MKAPAFRRALLKKVLTGQIMSRPTERFCDDQQLNNAIAWLRGTPRADAVNSYFIVYQINGDREERYRLCFDIVGNVMAEVIPGKDF